ncbi:hypothetical protein DH2020_007633 [Rehmannia glutinosa]|uniref:Uncharacterized protein n=1 Tax=Rehmannia glutinosa TaxID=99300 RepID=A0ABR0TZ25_REHGL
MELRSCGTTHFIQTIRGGLLIKVCNINSKGRPVIRSKSLKDVYENEETNRLRRPSPGLVFVYEQVKCENPCFPVADRTLGEVKPKIDDEFVPHADDADSDLDDDTTLKQLKKRFLTKKRKCIHSDENSKKDNEKPVEEEYDLYEPLINWKPKRSKTSKAGRKHMNQSVVSSSTVDFAIESEENLVSEGSQQVGGEPAPVIRVKVEVPDPEQSGYQNNTPSADASSNNHDEGLNPSGVASNEYQKMVLPDYREPLLCARKYQNCVNNEIMYGHVEDVEPISMLVPWDGMSVKLEPLETDCDEFLDLPPLAVENQKEIGNDSRRSSLSEDPDSDACSHSRSSSSMEDISEQQSSSGIQISDMAIDGVDGSMGLHTEFNSVLFEDKTEADFPSDLDDSLSSPDTNCGSYPVSITSLKIEDNLVSTEDTIADEEQPTTCSFNVITRNGLNCDGHIEGELLKAEEKQTSAFPITDAGSQSSLNQNCDIADIISTSESCLPPENLLSTRNAISPSSQERLRLEMNSVEIWNDANQNIVSECKGKLFEKQTAKKDSSLRSDIQYDKVTVNHRQPGKVSRRKVMISPRHNIRKSHISKGNLEGPRFSRTLPKLSTECTSIQDCSESAIAFSKQQMYDMESLAVKLMNELKSMKDIVEQKLIFEAYRNISLKNVADEKMTPDSTPPKDTVPRERRKIMFADEAGGELCHVKFYEDGLTSPVTNGVKQ